MYGENMRSPEEWRNDPAAGIVTNISVGRPSNAFIRAVQADAWNGAIEEMVDLFEDCFLDAPMRHNLISRIRALKKKVVGDAKVP